MLAFRLAARLAGAGGWFAGAVARARPARDDRVPARSRRRELGGNCSSRSSCSPRPPPRRPPRAGVRARRRRLPAPPEWPFLRRSLAVAARPRLADARRRPDVRPGALAGAGALGLGTSCARRSAPVPNPGQPALADHPALEVVKGFATMIPPPVLLLALGTALAVVRRERILLVLAAGPQPGSPSSPPWPEAGFSGKDRYPGRRRGRRRARWHRRRTRVRGGRCPRTARRCAGRRTAVVAAVAAAIPAARRVGSELAYAAELRSDAAAAVERAGGPDRLRSAVRSTRALPLPARRLAPARPHLARPRPEGPGVVFSSKLRPGEPDSPSFRPATSSWPAPGPGRCTPRATPSRPRPRGVSPPHCSACWPSRRSCARGHSTPHSGSTRGSRPGSPRTRPGRSPGCCARTARRPRTTSCSTCGRTSPGRARWRCARRPWSSRSSLSRRRSGPGAASSAGRPAGSAPRSRRPPFLTLYAQEARMYALVGLLSVLAAAAFTHALPSAAAARSQCSRRCSPCSSTRTTGPSSSRRDAGGARRVDRRGA